jgi:RNA polymerase sigma-70 factor (ECF subfamily)
VDVDHDTEGDDELVRRTVGGDQRALSALFDRHAATVTRYAWALAETRMDVEEIVQDTFVTLWKKVDQIDLPDDSLLPWLLVVCRNHAANLRRKQARAATDALPDELVAPDDGQEARDRLRWVRDEIDALGPVDRQIVELCLIEGRPYGEAAAQVGLSLGAVTQRVSRTRSRLKKKAVMNDEL